MAIHRQAESRSKSARTVLVVGASSGIGQATALQLSRRGDRVVLVSRDRGRLEDVSRQLPGPNVVAPADLTVADEVDAAFRAAHKTFGSVDAVVTTAQPMAYGTVEEVPPQVLARMAEVAIVGTSHLARSALPRFRQQGGGSLVVVSSLLAQIAVPSMGAYCAVKWGQLGLVRTLQAEVRRVPGVGVSLVLPGSVDTPIYRQAATYAGRRGSAPPPVLKAETVARAVVAAVDRPRRTAHVGPVNRIGVLGFRLAPGLYERVAPLLVDHVVLRGPTAPDDDGNVFAARPEREGLDGGWTVDGRLRTPGSRRARWRA